MKHLDSSQESLQIVNHHLKNREATDQFQMSDEILRTTGAPATLDTTAPQAPKSRRTVLPVDVNRSQISLDLNSEALISNSSPNSGGCPELTENVTKGYKVPTLKKHHREHGERCATSGGIGLHLNEQDVASSINHEHPDQLTSSRELSECASRAGLAEGKDPLKLWAEMKQNGFLSSFHGGISFQSGLVSSSHGGISMPKQRGRKTKSDVLKKRMELAKKEQVDRFTKIAAPSGHLNGLNPGIINHVRNKKQVHSIIEALVKSEKGVHGHAETEQESHVKIETKQTNKMVDSRLPRLGSSEGSVCSAILSGSKEIEGCHISGGEGDFGTRDRISARTSVSHGTAFNDGNVEVEKLSTLTKASEESNSFSNEDSVNGTNISSLSVQAASVASHWLELLHQDIKGRLSALRCSKKRVQSVITTELPFLISKEFAANQVNDPYSVKSSFGELPNNSISSLDEERWNMLFDQMDKALSEEEKQLESWLNQVREMQLHCDQGLQNSQVNSISGLQPEEVPKNYIRTEKANNAERELAVRAAAASIYSTCSFLMSKENV